MLEDMSSLRVFSQRGARHCFQSQLGPNFGWTQSLCVVCKKSQGVDPNESSRLGIKA